MKLIELASSNSLIVPSWYDQRALRVFTALLHPPSVPEHTGVLRSAKADEEGLAVRLSGEKRLDEPGQVRLS